MGTEATIDKEFAALCPPLTFEELNLLETSIIADGCHESLDVWEHGEKLILVDGHNRHDICRRYDKPFKTRKHKFASREEAREFVITKQLARRNLTEDQKSYLRGKRYVAEKKSHGGDRKSEKSSTQNGNLKTAEKIAAECNVGKNTIARDAEYANAVDSIATNAGKAAKDAILTGSLKVTKQDVVKLAELSPAKQKALVAKGADAVREAVAPPTPPKKISDTFYHSLKGLAERIEGIREQYGSAREMFDSPVWDGCDTQFVIELVHELHRMFTALDKEMQDYAKAQEKELRKGSGARSKASA